MQKLVEWVSEPSSDLKIPFHVSCKFVFLCLVKASSCNQTEKKTWLLSFGGENAQTKRPRQEEQKRSRKEAFVNFLNWLKAKPCETALWKSAPLRCFYFKKIKDRNFDLLHFCMFRAACWVFCCCFFALCRVPFVHARLRKTLWHLFLCAAKLATKKSQVVRFVVVFVFFVSLCVRCGSSGGRLRRKTLPNRGPLQQWVEPSFHSWCNFQNGFCKGSWILGHAS